MKKEKKRVKVYINEIEVSVLENSTVLQACEHLGVKVPRFCYHEKLSIAGNCRMCLVEVKNTPKLQASCALPVAPDMRIFTDTLAVRKAREGIMELLLINHPLDCPICDQGGECDLQDQAMYYGSDHGRFNEYKRATSNKNFGPLIKTIMNRCIHCTRCVRFATEIAGCPEVGTIGRGSNMEISTFVSESRFSNSLSVNEEEKELKALAGVLDSELSGNLIDICPVGALTSLPYAFVARPWECKSIESIDVSDPFCSNIKVDLRGQGPGSILRVLPSDDLWISDKTRFSYDGLKRQRLVTPLSKSINSKLTPVSWTDIDTNLQSLIKDNNSNISIFVGNNLDYQSALELKELTNNNSNKLSLFFVTPDASRYTNNSLTSINTYNFNNLQDFNQSNSLKTKLNVLPLTQTDLDEADLVLLIGTNPRLESPALNACLQKIAKRGTVGLIGSQSATLPYPVIHLGLTTSSLVHLNDSNKFSKAWNKSQRKLILIGSSILHLSDTNLILSQIENKFKDSLHANSVDNKTSVHFLYQSVSEVNAYKADLDIVKLNHLSSNTIKNNLTKPNLYIYYNLPSYALNHPLIKASLSNDKGSKIYIGSHGNALTNLCELILPITTYTEKESEYYTLLNEKKRSSVITYPVGSSITDTEVFTKLKLCLT